MKAESSKAVLAAMLANLGIAVAKFVGFALTGASSMLAEAIHSVADTGNQALLLWGGARAKQAPTALHPFGFGRERYFWSFIVALVLFALGSLSAIHEGVAKFTDPGEITNAQWAVWVLLLGVLLEGWSFRTAVREAKTLKRGRSWWSFIRTSRNPELPVVLLEDFGALIGLFLALGGIGLTYLTGDGRFDAGATILIGVLLGLIAVVLAFEMKSLLIGESAAPQVVESIAAAISRSPACGTLIHLRTLHLGPEELLVAAKVSFVGLSDLPALAQAIDDLERRIRAVDAARMVIYIEPDIMRSSGSAIAESVRV